LFDSKRVAFYPQVDRMQLSIRFNHISVGNLSKSFRRSS